MVSSLLFGSTVLPAWGRGVCHPRIDYTPKLGQRKGSEWVLTRTVSLELSVGPDTGSGDKTNRVYRGARDPVSAGLRRRRKYYDTEIHNPTHRHLPDTSVSSVGPLDFRRASVPLSRGPGRSGPDQSLTYLHRVKRRKQASEGPRRTTVGVDTPSALNGL